MPLHLVTPQELRRRFNDGNYLERAISGEFTCCLRNESTANSPDEPLGTRSLTVGYLDREGRRTFLVHLYLRPSGEIGGRGRMDPKWLIEDGAIYYVP